MTFKLTLYSNLGVKIGWVTADPYEYSITHDHYPNRFENIERVISDHEPQRRLGPVGGADDEQLHPGIIEEGYYEPADPQPHLEALERELLKRNVGSTVLEEVTDG